MTSAAVGADPRRLAADRRGDWITGWPFAALLVAVYVGWAGLLISNADLAAFHHETLDQVFNDMARRLLTWDFTISPSAILYEAFVWRGETYTYYGVFPALLRLPLILAGYTSLSISRVSCLVALAIAVGAYIRMVQGAWRAWWPAAGGRPIIAVALLSVLLTGPQVYLLASASLYHELVFWSSALTAVFIATVLRAWLQHRALTAAELLALATLAGLTLLCRVPEGIGLYATLLLLFLHIAVQSLRRQPPQAGFRRWLGFATDMRFVLAAGCVSLLFVAALGVINYERWGDALKTAPYAYYIQFNGHQDWLDNYDRHGLFSWLRVLVSIAYYLTALKVDVVLPDIFREYYGFIEGPRSLMLACAPLTFVLFSVGLRRTLLEPSRHAVPLIVLAGECVGILVVLGFPALTVRYTFIFWGVLMTMATVGIVDIRRWTRRRGLTFVVFATLLMVGGAASQLMLIRYKLVSVSADPAVRLMLSERIQPFLCPRAPLNPEVKLTDFLPLITPSCPPMW